MSQISAANPAQAAAQVVNSPLNGGGEVGGAINQQKDSKESARQAQFGELLNQMQAKYGAKAEKPREIKKTLGKDDFLRIMVTQMKNQDPTNPFKADQMAAQMAQFASVEQLQNLNAGFNKMAQNNQPLERMAMTNMIGKSVTTDGSRFAHQEGDNESLSFNLPRDAKEVKVTILSEQGETIFQKDLGATKKGEGSFTWDGKRVNSLPAKAGNYMLRVEAKDEREADIVIETKKRSRVIGVSFEGSEPVLLVGDAKHTEKVPVKSVVRVDSDAPAPSIGAPMQMSMPMQGAQGGAQQAEGETQAAAQNNGNFFTFQKGVGSSNLDSTQASPEIAAALARYQAASGAGANTPANPAAQAQGGAATAAQHIAQDAQEKGFPNGLSEMKD